MEFREWAIRIHYYAAYGTLLLAALHAGAALKHQFIDRDGVLARMGWR
jgi:cytochrome b561